MASQLLENIVEIHENTGKYRKNRHHLFFLCLHLWEIRLADFQTCSDTLPDPAAVFYAYFHIGTAIAGHSATPCVSMNSCWSLSNPKPFFYAPWNPIESFSVQFPWASFLFWIELRAELVSNRAELVSNLFFNSFLPICRHSHLIDG